MRKPLIHTHCHLICCVYIKGHVSIHIVWCWRCWDRLKQEIKTMSKMSKMVFAAFMQHCIQSTVTHLTHVKGVEDAKYYVLCIQWPLAPARREGLFVTVQYLNSLPSWGFSGSPPVSPRRQLSWTCQTTRVIAGQTHSQSPILKTNGCSATR